MDWSLQQNKIIKIQLAIDGITYVNNSFYTTFKNLAISSFEQYTYQITSAANTIWGR